MMNQYVKYKATNLSWCSELPEDYVLSKLKYLVEVKDGTHDTPSYVVNNEDAYPLVTSKDLNNGLIDFTNVRFISKEDHVKIISRSNVAYGDIIMPMIGTVGGAAIVNVTKEFSIKNVALFKTSNGNIHAGFLKYLLDSNFITTQFELVSRGGVQNFVSLDILKNLIVPKSNAQDKIALYLDKKSIEINNIISQKEMLIEKLKDERTEIINHAVVKG